MAGVNFTFPPSKMFFSYLNLTDHDYLKMMPCKRPLGFAKK